MNNSPNMPHVQFQPIRTYGYDVIDVWLWCSFVFTKMYIIINLLFHKDLLDIVSLYI